MLCLYESYVYSICACGLLEIARWGPLEKWALTLMEIGIAILLLLTLAYVCGLQQRGGRIVEWYRYLLLIYILRLSWLLLLTLQLKLFGLIGHSLFCSVIDLPF